MSVRFAPSPTGVFHVGNLRTAWVSHFFAQSLKMPWVVRFEDIDGPRVMAGAMEQQLADMKSLGLLPAKVVVQSDNFDRHKQLFRKAVEAGVVYPCTCSRKEVLQELQNMASAPHEVPALYNGRCRTASRRMEPQHPTIAWRFANPASAEGHHDFIIGRTTQLVASDSDFMPAYHWACAIDDHDGDHSLLVRANDLAHAAVYQKVAFDWLAALENTGRRYPAVFHTALVTGTRGDRLEKRTRGVTLAELNQLGISSENLTQIFATSFSKTVIQEFEPHKLWNEIPARLSISDLHLT